jgi:predicted transcriptional regulator
MQTMAKEKPRTKKFPSREGIKYIPLPVELWERLAAIGKKDERSVSFMGRKAVRKFVEDEEKKVG